MYHRYYYTCGSSSCDDMVFSLHKFCAELPPRLEKGLHRLPLIQQRTQDYPSWSCFICESHHKYPETQICYRCDECVFKIDVKCAMEVGKRIIHHPCHPHLLMWAIPQPILCKCKACGKEHKGIFYQCTTCVGFTIHSECAFLPEKLKIQDRTDGAFYHTHPLTISYSFPYIDQEAKHWPRCRVCGDDFCGTQNLWIYKCDKCLYYAHLDCATSRKEPFMSIFLSPAGLGKTVKNYEDADHPGLLHLPFPDETYSLPKHLFFQQADDDDHHHHKVDDHLKHMSHQHPLLLVDVDQTQSKNNAQTSSSNSFLLLKCHDPMKKTQLLCNGCLRPIMSTMPFYTCANANANDDQIQGGCNDFALHEWCTRLPQEIENHPGHPHHTLHLICSNIPDSFFGVFGCKVCDLPCNGFAYCCVECEYYVDVTCGLIPKQITHKAHPNHLLSILVVEQHRRARCHMCRTRFYRDKFSFHCSPCGIDIHSGCALLLAETIRHKYDKHPLNLSYLPIENHKSQYFCEICEEDLNPHQSFYHCHDCAQSVHAACAPSILQSETHTYGWHSSWQRTYYFMNIKFGGIHKTHSHPHPLSFAQGTVLDGRCRICHKRLRYEMIFKCLECRFTIDYECCERLNQT